jgi:phospholipase/lecithinase/hemolysin
MKIWFRFLAALAAPVLLAAGTVTQYSALYVFGDSYSDIGEGYLDCDGPTAVAFLAERLGLKLLPSNDPQVNNRSSLDFAVSGAQTGNGEGKRTGDALLSFGMRNQVDSFSHLVQAHILEFQPQSTLFFLAGGLNDRKLPTEITVANLEDEIKQLYALGGRHFRVALMPTAIPAFSEVGLRLNPAIVTIPAALLPQLPGADISLSHWGAFFDEVIKNPAAYGIKNTTDACAGRAIFHQDSTPCVDPAAHFYFHAGHPSMAVHRIVGQKLYQELSEPAP